jgi:hypothetical protein
MSPVGLIAFHPTPVDPTRRINLRRTLILTTALFAVIAVGVAYAGTLNSYTASLTFSPNKAGSAAKPVALGFNEKLSAKNKTSGKNAAPLTDIKLTLYGLKSNFKYFPTCTYAQISAAKNDAGCKKGALVAQGPVTAILGPKTLDPSGSFQCNPLLDVWNGGNGQLVFFFVTTGTPGSAHYCNGITTGTTPPYVGTVKQAGKNLIQDTPLPPTVSTNVVGVFYGSLVLENLTWKKLSVKAGGKSYPYLESVGCKAGKRPWTVAYTATDGSTTTTDKISGAAKCS